MTPSFLCVPCRDEWCGENKHPGLCHPQMGKCSKCGTEREYVLLCYCPLERCPECRHPEGWHEVARSGEVLVCLVGGLKWGAEWCTCRRVSPPRKPVPLEVVDPEPQPIRRQPVNLPEQDRKTMATGER